MKKFLLLGAFLVAVAPGTVYVQAQLSENIDRGVIGLTIDGTHAYIGWRLLKSDPAEISFNVYRKEAGSTEFRKVNTEDRMAFEGRFP